MVPLPNESPTVFDCALRGNKEAIRADAQADASRKVRGALQGSGCCERCEEFGPSAEVYGDWKAVRICGVYVV